MENIHHEEIRAHRRKVQNCKTVALVLAMLMLVGCVVGGTLAWLTAKSTEVTNVFTTSDITVELEEKAGTINQAGEHEFKMIPGWTIEKDPKVMVSTDSEDCYLFVKVEKEQGVVTYTPAGSKTPDTTKWEDFLSYEIASGWEKLNTVQGVDNVYYRVIDKAYVQANADSAQDMKNVWYPVLKDNQVTVKNEVTKEMMQAITKETRPTLTFTAYAVQLWKTNKPAEGADDEQIAAAQFTAAEAWAKIGS